VKPLVVDGSAVLAFLLTDESTPLAFRILDRIEATPRSYVPGHFWFEAANGLLMAERRKRASQAEIARALQMLSSLPLLMDEESGVKSGSATLALAREFGLTVYDAAYLELAIRHRASLATVDAALVRAGRRSGLEIVV